jgi:Ca-activated chloride channel family protein
MHWAYPNWVWLSVVAAGIAILMDVARMRRRRALERLALPPAVNPLVMVSRVRQGVKTALLAMAAALLAVVAVGPQWGKAEEQTQAASGRDVLFVLDVSRSMLAEDAKPNRLARARADIQDLATYLEQQGGYRVGLIAFADHASVLCPLTFDYRAFEEELGRVSLESLRSHGSSGSGDGTQIGDALRRAASAIDKEQAAFTDVVLLSDGDDMEPDTVSAADGLAKLGVRVHTVGIGNPNEGSLIPIQENGRQTYLKFRGEPVRTKLEEKVLQEIAKRTKGQYIAERTGYVPLDQAFGAIVANQPSRELQTAGQSQVWIHRYEWFLLPAILLLLAEMMVGEQRQGATPHLGKPAYFGWVKRKRPNPLAISRNGEQSGALTSVQT